MPPEFGGYVMTSQRLNDAKCFTVGTHRVCPPEITLDRIREKFSTMGITRLAELTGMDKAGVAVYQAINPTSPTRAISLGRGITRVLASISAAMRSLEVWHSERMEPTIENASIAELSDISLCRLKKPCMSASNACKDNDRIAWTEAFTVLSNQRTWIPYDRVSLTDMATASASPHYLCGVASGNSKVESILHGLYEIIEHDAVIRAAKTGGGQLLQLDDVGPDCSILLERMQRSDINVAVYNLSDLAGMPCFRSVIWSPSYPHRFSGYGCHLNRSVALSRALTDSAQMRLAAISGLGENSPDCCSLLRRWKNPHPPLRPGRAVQGRISDVPSLCTPEMFSDLVRVVGILQLRTGCEPLFVDMSVKEIDIPVTRVLAPGLPCARVLR